MAIVNKKTTLAGILAWWLWMGEYKDWQNVTCVEVWGQVNKQWLGYDGFDQSYPRLRWHIVVTTVTI